MTLLAAVLAWTLILWVVVGLCAAARLGDSVESVPQPVWDLDPLDVLALRDQYGAATVPGAKAWTAPVASWPSGSDMGLGSRAA